MGKHFMIEKLVLLGKLDSAVQSENESAALAAEQLRQMTVRLFGRDRLQNPDGICSARKSRIRFREISFLKNSAHEIQIPAFSGILQSAANFLTVFSRTARFAGDISQSGRRYSSSIIPRIAIAAFTGIGFVSMKRSLKRR